MDVLVVDDDESNRRVIAAMLEGLGYRVFSVATIEDAVAVVYVYDLTLLVTDWRIGSRTPENLLALVKKMSPECRRVVLSGTPRQESGYAGTGVDIWLVKPVPLATLRRALVRDA